MKEKLIIWLKAARLKLHILGLLPVAVGSLIAFNKNTSFSFPRLVFAELITLFVLIATAFANDYADAQTDNINRSFNMFSGGSRLIVDGIISGRQMLRGVYIASLISLVISIVFVVFLGADPAILVFNFIGLFIGIEYSLPPLRINYRGGGDFFVMFMYSLFCLYFGYVTQVGLQFEKDIIYFSIPIAIAVFLIILITEVPDYDSDKISGKKTIPTILGKENSLFVYFLSVVSFYAAVLILCKLTKLDKIAFWGTLLSLPLGIYMCMTSIYKNKTSSKNIFTLCGLTIILNVWVNTVLSLSLLFG